MSSIKIPCEADHVALTVDRKEVAPRRRSSYGSAIGQFRTAFARFLRLQQRLLREKLGA